MLLMDFEPYDTYISQRSFIITIMIGSALPNLSLWSYARGRKQHTYNYTLPNHSWLTVMISIFQLW